MKTGETLIVILGPTACGKAETAAAIAARTEGEIISADSRQVYKGMDIGTGKDLGSYFIEGKEIPYHLIDIVEPGYEYNVFEYTHDFKAALTQIKERNRQPILCGGSGLYLEAALKGYSMQVVPEDIKLREKMDEMSTSELTDWLNRLRSLHNTTDTLDRSRLYRAIEIALISNTDPQNISHLNSRIFGIYLDREKIREKITLRLWERMSNGMPEETRQLLDNGVPAEVLRKYGLEYRYLTAYLIGELSYEEMFSLLNTAIHQFAKRQMTWFRRMEKQGFKITWLDAQRGKEKNCEYIIESMNQIN